MKYIEYHSYNVYEDGEVFSTITNKFLKPDFDKWGYKQVTLRINKKPFRIKVHRLVCHLFNGMELLKENTVDHIDGNKLNNYYTNLECVSVKENNKRAREKGLNILTKEHNGRAYRCFKHEGKLYYSWELAEKLNLKLRTLNTYRYRDNNTAKKFLENYGIEVIKPR